MWQLSCPVYQLCVGKDTLTTPNEKASPGIPARDSCVVRERALVRNVCASHLVDVTAREQKRLGANFCGSCHLILIVAQANSCSSRLFVTGARTRAAHNPARATVRAE
jgi:hypothetical protein